MTNESLHRRAALAAALVLLVSGCGIPTETTPSAGPAEPGGAIAPYPGWTELARFRPDDVGANGEATATGERGASRFLLISALCTTGVLTITAPGAGEVVKSPVPCPVVTDPQRSMVFLGDEVAGWDVRVLPSGAVDFEVLVEGSDIPLHIPPIVVTAGDMTVEMHGGCWSISLSWGYDAADQCGTTIPGEPIETIGMEQGTAASIAIDGWQITRATALCGRLDRGAGHPDLFEAMPDCTVQATLDGRGIRLDSLKASPEPWLVELNLTARSGWGDEFSGPFYAYVSIR